ncbi:MAG: hypothetical protein HZB39_14560 [Planctomycetes bacterium]|nr:hypothetical protein [Planctomycetota bacterium]
MDTVTRSAPVFDATLLASALGPLPIFLVALDESGKVLFWRGRAAEETAVTVESATGRQLTELGAVPVLEHISWLAPASLAEPGKVVTDAFDVQAGARKKPLRLSAWALADRSTTFVTTTEPCPRCAATTMDFGSKKLEAIGQLAAGIAHEINTPMQYVSDNTSYLRETVSALLDAVQPVFDPRRDSQAAGVITEMRTRLTRLAGPKLREELERAFTDVRFGIDRVVAIVRAMKVFSHPDGDRMEQVDLNSVIESTVTISSNEWKYDAELHTELDPSSPKVRGNRGQLSQVLLNLIVNAVHAIQDKPGRTNRGHITIRTKAVDGGCALELADDGCGMDATVQARLFEPFFTTKDVGRGTGQGLSLVRSIVTDRHRGRIDFTSETGRGTTFRLFLPSA